MRKLKLYLDACCLNRPFDDQIQETVRLETRAIARILAHCESGELALVSGAVLRRELVRHPDDEIRAALLDLERLQSIWVPLGPEIVRRATEYQAAGLSSEDALHLGTAEEAGVDYFLSTDYALLRKASRITVSFGVLNPREFAEREMTHG